MTYWFGKNDRKAGSETEITSCPEPKQDDRNDPQHHDKCKFCVTEETYLGHKLTGGGVQPDQTKIEAISYLATFIQGMPEITAPLRDMFRGTGRLIIKLYLRK